MAKENPSRLWMPPSAAPAEIFIVQIVEESRIESPTKIGN